MECLFDSALEESVFSVDSTAGISVYKTYWLWKTMAESGLRSTVNQLTLIGTFITNRTTHSTSRQALSIRRSEQICNTAEAANHERRHLIQVFQSNGYPTAFIQWTQNKPLQRTNKQLYWQPFPSLTSKVPVKESDDAYLRWTFGLHSGAERLWDLFSWESDHDDPHWNTKGWSTKYHATTVIKSTSGRQGDLWSQD